MINLIILMIVSLAQVDPAAQTIDPPQEEAIPQVDELTREEESAPEEGSLPEREYPLEEDALAEEEAPVMEVPPQKVELYRLSDRITIWNHQRAEEQVLFYNNKMVLLEEDDEVRQGSSAISEIRFEDDGKMRFFSRARFRFGSLSQDDHVVHVEDCTRILIQAKDYITLLLPGGTRLKATQGECYIEREAFFLHIRNAGFSEIQLSGYLVDPEDAVIPAGHTLSIPLFDPELKSEAEPIVVREVAGLIVKTTGGYSFEEKPGFIVVSRPGIEEGIACVGGARIFLDPGGSLKLRLP